MTTGRINQITTVLCGQACLPAASKKKAAAAALSQMLAVKIGFHRS